MKKKMSLGSLIVSMFMIMWIILLIVCIGSYTMTSTTEETGNQLFEEYGNTQGDVGMGLAYFQDVKCSLRNALFLYADDATEQAGALDSLNASKEKMYTYFENAKDHVADKKASVILQEAINNVDKYISDVDICIDCLEADDLEGSRAHLMANGIDSAKAAVASVEELNVRLDSQAKVAQNDLNEMKNTNSILIAIFLIVSIINCFISIKIMMKQVKKPVVAITEAAQHIAKGEIDVVLPDDSNVREVSTLRDDFGTMIQNLKNQAYVVGQLSEGNLQVDIKPNSEKDVVGVALNKLIHDDNSAFASIRNASNQISLGSGQIAAASQTLAQGSTEQASAIEQIAASVTDIASKTKNNAEQANEVNKIVLETKENVDTGNVRMEEMIAAMNEINDASENIQKIIKVIDDIAFNTNILALNATVEAARAGEQGKGFAVVAEEVRNLAGRSAEASSQTAEMIEDSIHKVKRGGELAKDMAEALKVVSDRIEDITKLSEGIAESSNEQASATDQIDQALMQVSQVVQTNSATSEQCASASEELSGQARGLDREVARFKLKDVIGNMPSQTLEYTQPEMLSDTSKY